MENDHDIQAQIYCFIPTSFSCMECFPYFRKTFLRSYFSLFHKTTTEQEALQNASSGQL